MKTTTCLLWIILLSGYSFGQHPPQWVNASPDYLRTGAMLATDSYDNLVMAGYRPSFVGRANFFTRKLDPLGNLLWEQTDSSGVAGKYYKVRWVNTDALDNILVTGYRYSGTSNEYTDTIVAVKYDPSGTLLWKREIGHVWPSSLNLRSAVDAAGNLYIGTVGVSPGFTLVKLDPNGNVLFNVSDASSLNQDFTSMRLKGDRVVMTSYAFNGSQVSICAFDTAGNFLWSQHFPSRGGMDVEIDDSLNTYLLTQEQNVVTPASGYDIEIFKFNPAGVQVARYDYDFGGGYDVGTRMTLVNGKISVIGKSILPGQAYMDWITFQTDLAGNKLWDARYGFSATNDEKPSWVTATPAGDVYVSGQGGPDTVGATGTSFLRYVTVKYRNGVTQWTDAHPYQGYVGVASATDSQCGLYVLGATSMTAIHYTDSCFTVGLDEPRVQRETLKVFPNPVANELAIPASWANAAYAILDVGGRIVARGALPAKPVLDITHLPPAWYVLVLAHHERISRAPFVVCRP